MVLSQAHVVLNGKADVGGRAKLNAVFRRGRIKERPDAAGPAGFW